MANKASTPLKSAMGGDIEKLNDKQTKNALTDAVDKLGKVRKLAETSKEQVARTGTALMHSAETMGSLFVSSMAEGFFGPERIQLGGVDVRAPSGLLMQGYGLYQILSGGEGGEHFLSVGNGVTGSWLASVGQDAGRVLRERRHGGAPAPAPAPAPAQGTSFRGEEQMVHILPLENGYGPSYGGPVYGGAAQYGVAGLLPPPNLSMHVPAQPGWQAYEPAPYPPQAYPYRAQPAAGAPSANLQVGGPVREIMPDEGPRAYAPSPYQGADGFAPDASRQTNAPARPVMQFTPETEPPPPNPARQTMRFTPEMPERATTPTQAAATTSVAGPFRRAPHGSELAENDDVSGPRQHRQQRREERHHAIANRFPRARRAQETDLEAD